MSALKYILVCVSFVCLFATTKQDVFVAESQKISKKFLINTKQFSLDQDGNAVLRNNLSKEVAMMNLQFVNYFSETSKFIVDQLHRPESNVWLLSMSDRTTIKITQTRPRIDDSAVEFLFVWHLLPVGSTKAKPSDGEFAKRVCFDIDDASTWFATYLHPSNAHWPMNNDKHFRPQSSDSLQLWSLITSQESIGPMLEYLFVNSGGFALMLDDLRQWNIWRYNQDSQRHLCFSIGLFDFDSEQLAPDHPEQFYSIKFRILLSDNIQTVHQSAMCEFYYIPRPKSTPTDWLFLKPIVSVDLNKIAVKKLNQDQKFVEKMRKFYLNTQLHVHYDLHGDLMLPTAGLSELTQILNQFNFTIQLLNIWPSIKTTSNQAQKENQFLMKNSESVDIKWWDFSSIITFEHFTESLRQNNWFEGFVLNSGDTKSFQLSPTTAFQDELLQLYPNALTTRYAQTCQSPKACFVTSAYKSQTLVQFVILQEKKSNKLTLSDAAKYEEIHWAITQAITASMAGYPLVVPFPFDDTQFHALWYIRWFQAMLFMPAFRFPFSFETTINNETVQNFHEMLKFRREFIMPILEKCTERWIKYGEPIIRPMWYAAPDDPASYAVTDQYMIGDDIIVAPIWKFGQVERVVYLPKGFWKAYDNATYSSSISRFTVLPTNVVPYFQKVHDTNVVFVL